MLYMSIMISNAQMFFPHVCCNTTNSLFGDVQNAQSEYFVLILLMCVWVVFLYIIYLPTISKDISYKYVLAESSL